MSSYSFTRSRTLQYIGILLALALLGAGYWYFAVRAGVKTNTTGGQVAGANDPANGLAAYWKFDENTGTTTTDGSVNGATGTLTNGPTWTTGQIGYAIDFDGTDDYVTAPDSEPLELALERSRFTIAGWFNRDTATTDDTIIAKRNGITAAEDGYIVYIDDVTDQLVFEFSDGVDEVSTVSTTTFTATGWHHFVVTQLAGDGNPRVYIDGQLEAASVTGNINDMEPVGNALAMRVGAESDAGNPFDGKLDEIRYYHARAFTAEQVAELYRLTAPTGVDTSLKGYWSFDGQEVASAYIYDQSGAGNRGALVNGPTASGGRLGQAIRFDGTNDYATMGAPANLANFSDLSVCFWTNRTGGGSMITKDASATGWNVDADDTNGRIQFYAGWSTAPGYGQWVTANGSFPTGEWKHVCVTYNHTSPASDPTIYIDSVSMAVTEVQAPAGSQGDDSAMYLNFGNYDNGSGGSPFNGRLDEIRIYNRILTAAEIRSLYSQSTPDKTNTGATQSQGGSDLGAGLALYWPLDENTGTNADDKSANANDGTLTGGPTWTTGQIGSGVDFDGTDDYIAVADPASGVLDFTPATASGAGTGDVFSVSAWFNRDTATTDDTIIAKKNSQSTDTDNGYIIWIDDATDEINVRVDDVTDFDHSEVESSTTYTAAGWHHLVVVFDEYIFGGGQFACPIIYVDGVNVTDTGTCANYLHYSNDLSNAVAFTVGAESDGGNPFDGKIDEVRVYSRPIGASEINQLYRLTAPTTGIDTGLRGYWSFNAPDTAGTGAYDRSGGNNFGTLTNSPVAARGRLGQALQFDGTNDYVDAGSRSTIDNLTSKSGCAWINPSNSVAIGTIMSKSTSVGWELSIEDTTGGADLELYVSFSGVDGVWDTAADAITYGKWQHVCFTYDNSSVSNDPVLYIDGVVAKSIEAQTPTGTADTDAGENFKIGALGAAAEPFYGSIDEIRYYDRILTVAEVKGLYDAGSADKTNSGASTPQGTGRLDSGLVGYWKLDENTGTSAGDTSVGGNTGTITNGPAWTTGRIGSALSFDGTNDYVTMGDIAAAEAGGTNQVTAAAWIKQNGATNEKHFLDKGSCSGTATNSWELHVLSGEPYFYIPAYGGAAIGTGLSVSDNQWHHIVGTYDGSMIRVYVDGVMAGQQAASVTLGTDASAVELGGNCNGGGSCGGSCYWNGQIDEARVYDRALSNEEIAQLYQLNAPTGTDTGLKGYWSFNGPDMSGTTAYDRSGAGNEGTLTNSPTLVRGKLGQALSLDGTNDYVSVGTAFDFSTASFTLTSWVKPTSFPDFGTIIAKRDTYSSGDMRFGFLLYSGTGQVTFDCGTGGQVIFAYSPPTNEWTHLALTVTTTSTDLYVNGSFSESLAGCTVYGTDATAETRIGSVPDGPDAFTGAIDEVRAYSRILSASEIKALYNSGR